MIIGKLASSVNKALAARVVCGIAPVILSDEASSNETIAFNQRVCYVKNNECSAVTLFIEFAVQNLDICTTLMENKEATPCSFAWVKAGLAGEGNSYAIKNGVLEDWL